MKKGFMWFENRDYYFINVITGLTRACSATTERPTCHPFQRIAALWFNSISIIGFVSVFFAFSVIHVIVIAPHVVLLWAIFTTNFPFAWHNKSKWNMEPNGQNERSRSRKNPKKKNCKKGKFTYRGRWPCADGMRFFILLWLDRTSARAFLFLSSLLFIFLCIAKTVDCCGASNGFMSY